MKYSITLLILLFPKLLLIVVVAPVLVTTLSELLSLSSLSLLVLVTLGLLWLLTVYVGLFLLVRVMVTFDDGAGRLVEWVGGATYLPRRCSWCWCHSSW